MHKTKSFGLLSSAAVGLLLGVSTIAQATPQHAFKVAAAPGLTTPTAADSYYCAIPGGGCTVSGSIDLWTKGYPPEILALADALHRSPDLIYEYVRNNIDTVFMYGLQKGALGALVDQSGTAFDQVQLMVDLLRASGFVANYQAGTITLTGAQMQSWIGVTDAASMIKILADGGIPATVTPTTGTVTSVTLSHIWVQANIPGSTCTSNCLFDPAYKTYKTTSPINFAAAMGWTTTATFLLAEAGTSQGSSVPFSTGVATDCTGQAVGCVPTITVPYITGVNNSAIQSTLSGYANNLISYLKANNVPGTPTGTAEPYASAQIDDLVGRHDIIATSGTVRQTALPYTSSAQHTWTNNIPNAYRTTLALSVTDFNGATAISRWFYVDEIYGRRLAFDTTADSGYHNFWTTLTVDWAAVPPQAGSLTATAQNIGQTNGRSVTMTVNHPYAAAGPSGTAGTYMDETVSMTGSFITSVAVVSGFGDTSPRLLAKLASEKIRDGLGPSTYTPQKTQCGGGTEPCDWPFGAFPSENDLTFSKIAADWLAQYTRQARIQSSMMPAVVQNHHHLGLSFAWSPLQSGTQVILDVNSAVSVNSKTGDANARTALSQSIAQVADALEGSVFEQQMDSADPESVSMRWGWAEENGFGQSTKFYLLSENAANNVNFSGILPATNGTLGDNLGNKVHGISPWSIVNAYLTDTTLSGLSTAAGAKYQTIVADNSYLGPGNQCEEALTGQDAGMFGPCPISSSLRGSAMMAYGTAGNSIAIAAVAGSYKGGGSGQGPVVAGEYDPAGAAQLLKDKFKDVTKQFGVDLLSGDLTYTAPADIDVGNNGFPYQLKFQRAFRSSTEHSPGLSSGWTHNWDIRLKVGSSGMAVMGDGPVVQSAESLVAFYVTQQLYYSQPLTQLGQLEQYALGPFVEHWWTGQVLHNVITRTTSETSEQYVRLPITNPSCQYNASCSATTFLFNPAHGYVPANGSSYSKLVQTGQPVLMLDTNAEPTGEWCYGVGQVRGNNTCAGTTPTFALTSPEQDVQQFTFWHSRIGNRNTDALDPQGYGAYHGWHLSSWTFPQGITINLSYYTQASYLDDLADDRLLSVSNSIGRSLTLSYVPSAHTIYDPNSAGTYLLSVADETSRAASFSGNTVTTPGSNLYKYGYDTRTTYSVNGPYPSCGAPMASRPNCTPRLTQIFLPSDVTNPKEVFGYDGAWRVNSYRDAVSVLSALGTNVSYTPPRGAYQFFITGTNRGERMDPLGYSYAAYYDAWGHAIQFIDELGRTTTATYDGLNRALTRTTPLGNSVSFQYNPKGKIFSITQYPYVTSPVTAQIPAVTAVYDSACNTLAQVTDANSNVTTWNYDHTTCLLQNVQQPAVYDGKTQTMKNPLTQYTYVPGIGLKQTVTDPTGVIVKFGYDSAYNLISRTVDPTPDDPIGLNLTTQYVYDSTTTTDSTAGVGNITGLIDGDNHFTLYSYDLDRRVSTVTAPTATCTQTQNVYTGELLTQVKRAKKCAPTATDWAISTTQYTATGQPYAVVDGSNFETLTAFDGADRATDVTLCLTANASSSPQNTCPAAGRTTHTVYDGAGQVSTVYKGWGSDDQITYARYTYTNNGQVQTTKDANSNTTTNVYNGYDRLYQLQLPDASFEQYAYDNNGNLTSKRNRDTKTITWNAYDALNRETTRNVPANSLAHYQRTLTSHYDLASRLWDQTVIDTGAGASTTQALYSRYDTAGRLTSVDDGYLRGLFNSGCAVGTARCFGSVVSGYDNQSNRTGQTLYGAGGTTTYAETFGYDGLNRVSTVSDTVATHAQYRFDALGRRCSTLNGIGGVCTWGNGTTTSATYRDDDDLTALSHAAGSNPSWSFTVNGAHQIAATSVTDNTVEMQATTTGLTFTTNNLNQYTAVNSATYSYKDSAALSNGNLTSDGTWAYEYDEENRLRKATGPHAVLYDYDPAGRRRSKSVDAVLTYYTSDGANEIAEWSAAGGALQRRYVDSGTDDHIVMFDYVGNHRYYYHPDWHQSIVLVSDEAKIVASTNTYRYDAYGAEPSTDSTTGNPFRYTGRRLDAETGLYYYRARYYSPTLGRFLQTDPVGSKDDLDLYAYVKDDPLNGSDPTGLCSFDNCTTTTTADQRTAAAQVAGTIITAASFVPGPVGDVVTVATSAVDFAKAAGSGDSKGMASALAGAVAGMVAGGEGKAAVGAAEKGAGAVEKAAVERAAGEKAAGNVTKETITRKSVGGDGAKSSQKITKEGGQTTSRTHTVTSAGGQPIHQHENFVGKAGGERQFPDEWTGTPTINAPYENIPPQ